MKQGPVVFMTVLPSGPMGMGGSLAGWFLYCVIVGLFADYLTSRALPADAPYLAVFCFTATVACAGAVTAHHLVQALVDDDAQVECRWSGVRAADRRRVRLVVVVSARRMAYGVRLRPMVYG